MNLHENEILFRQAIQATAQRMGEMGKDIPEIFIEKDYWITIALKQIFQKETGLFAIFKGGTALAKCHQLIERFSYPEKIVIKRSF